MNQIQAQQHMEDLIETFRIAYPMAFAAKGEDKQRLVDGIASMLRDTIKEGDTVAAAMVGIWFASRAPKPVLLAFLAFLEEGEQPDEEWPEEIGA